MPRKKKPRIPHHSDTAEHPIRPSDDIGPVYRFVGVLIIIGTVGVFLVGKLRNHPTSWIDIAGYGVAIVAGIFLIRPPIVDGWIKKVANALPSKISKYSLPSE